MRKLFLIICCLFFSYGQGQKIYKHYMYLYNSSSKPEFATQGSYLLYSGNDSGLRSFFAKYKILSFDRGFPSTNWESFSRVLILETESATLANDLISNFPTIYRKTEDLTDIKLELLAAYPNDYGNTNPNGNTGANIRRNDLDYINLPKAWDLTTGIDITSGVRTKIGLSDAKINDNNIDFINKVTHIGVGTSYLQGLAYNPTNPNTAHGTAVGGIAAARGNNGYGSVGVCYDCDIVHAAYGNYDNLLRLAENGARVINMSWVSHSSTTPYVRGSNQYYEVQQMTIDSITKHYKTVLVAGSGNWSSYQTATDHLCSNYFGTTWGINYCFPASYDGVISVSEVNYENPLTLPLVPALGATPSPFGFMIYSGIQGSITDINGTDAYNPVGFFYNGWEQHCSWGQMIESPSGLVTTATTNPEVDILAPTANTFRFDIYILNKIKQFFILEAELQVVPQGLQEQ
ncbi:S8 family serine peptidase [Flavobacterium sp. j3]|uniref:S8 family serine peptidase n=1 Tax=Flavobacterium aureirubrum TaxID=3133147 RepID=A0ABU9N6H3_9FLAO